MQFIVFHQERKVAIKLRISIRKVLVFSCEPHQSREFSGGHFLSAAGWIRLFRSPVQVYGSRMVACGVPSNTASDVPPLEMLCSRLHTWLEVTIPRLIRAHRVRGSGQLKGWEMSSSPTHPATICGGGISQVWWCPNLLSVFVKQLYTEFQ